MNKMETWVDSLTALGAALIGGGISGFIAFKIFRNESLERAKVRVLESDERYEVRLTEALAKVLTELALYAKSLQSRIVIEQLNGDFALMTAIDVAEIVAREEDLRMIQMLKRAFLFPHPKSSVNMLVTKLGIFSGAINAWRSGREPYSICIGEIEKTLHAEGPEVK